MAVNTNIASLNAPRNLGLSLGLRVSSAKDDAVGQAIAERMGVLSLLQ